MHDGVPCKERREDFCRIIKLGIMAEETKNPTKGHKNPHTVKGDSVSFLFLSRMLKNACV